MQLNVAQGESCKKLLIRLQVIIIIKYERALLNCAGDTYCADRTQWSAHCSGFFIEWNQTNDLINTCVIPYYSVCISISSEAQKC